MKFDNVFCSQCGMDFGPGNHGFSHCEDHKQSREQELHNLLDVLRYPSHYSMDDGREARLEAADLLERQSNALERIKAALL